MLDHRGEVPLNATFAWEYLIGRLLGEIAAEDSVVVREPDHRVMASADAVLA